ncbi:MAG: class I SAM-dependent methyltransferase [bacterium]
MTTNKIDLYSAVAKKYAASRPGYPNELFEYISSLCENHNLAYDIGTGAGNAAIGLASHFDKIIAVDSSEKQIANAKQHPKINYRTCPAEEIDFPAQSADLVLVSTALHWFNTELFHDKIRPILKPNAIYAAWTYYTSRLTPEIDELISKYTTDIGSHWPPQALIAFDKYKDIHFPFENELSTPNFRISLKYTFNEFIAYVWTWSGTQNYIKNVNVDLYDQFVRDTKEHWPNENEKKTVVWDLALKVFKHDNN